MASETVKKILEAEAEADRKNADARSRAEEIISSAESKAAVAVQKKLTEARTECDRIRSANRERLAEYTGKAEEKCSRILGELKDSAEKNMDKAVESVINGFFS